MRATPPSCLLSFMSAGSDQKTEEEQPTKRRYDTGKNEKGPEKLASRDLYKVPNGTSPLQNCSFRTSECSDLGPLPQAQSDSRAMEILPS